MEGRWGYFDEAGRIARYDPEPLAANSLHDCRNAAVDLSADSIRDEKVKDVLKSLRHIDRSNVREKTVRGRQYTAAELCAGVQKVPGYHKEGANKSSNTETFVAIASRHVNGWGVNASHGALKSCWFISRRLN
ncbi:hypothetical protein KCP71_17455 [Salmonella enterica subsp. enterica]|nr:hypothetical protein KCP71_17455 [Salmonella enterica subsp. enterica]